MDGPSPEMMALSSSCVSSQHHCSHCGKIFCIECLGKAVRSGPKMRSFPVCNVCHTLLDHDTAPYFSSEPPQTPS